MTDDTPVFSTLSGLATIERTGTEPPLTPPESGVTSYTEGISELREELRKAKDSIEKSEKDILKLNKDLERSKFDLITLIGLFVGLITYLGIEIQVFKIIDDPLLVIGISIFFIASILLFILTMNLVLKNDDGHIKLKSPLYKILIFLLISSIVCIAYENYLIHKDASQDIVATKCAS